jgi:hypothetical protein
MIDYDNIDWEESGFLKDLTDDEKQHCLKLLDKTTAWLKEHPGRDEEWLLYNAVRKMMVLDDVDVDRFACLIDEVFDNNDITHFRAHSGMDITIELMIHAVDLYVNEQGYRLEYDHTTNRNTLVSL